MKYNRAKVIEDIKHIGGILDVLKAVQAEEGFLADDAIVDIAKAYGIYPSEVYETATFYTMLHVGGKAEHVIEVCGSTCCDAGKAADLVKALEADLGISCGETSQDGKWMLRRCECLGRCDTAPNAMVDGTLVTDATVEGIIECIRKAGK